MMRVFSRAAFASSAAGVIVAAAIASAAPAHAATSPWSSFAPQAPNAATPRVISRAEAEAIVRRPFLYGWGALGTNARTAAPRRVPVQPAKGVRVDGWVVDNAGYLWGINKHGKIITDHTDCTYTGAGRVDHKGNLVVACGGGGELQGVPATLHVYKRGNTSAPADLSLTDNNGYIPSDAFEDNAGNLYEVNLLAIVCQPSGCDSYPGNVVRWSVGNQTSGALPDTTYADANLSNVQSGDIDAGGTIYLSGTNTSFAPEVDELSAGVVTNLDISLARAGDVYVVNPNGRSPLLSVVDEGPYQEPGGTLYQYALPVAPGNSPLFTDPTPQNLEGSCNPIGVGYSPAGAEFLATLINCQAIAYGIESAGPGNWKVREDDDFISPQIGLFVPSDK